MHINKYSTQNYEIYGINFQQPERSSDLESPFLNYQNTQPQNRKGNIAIPSLLSHQSESQIPPAAKNNISQLPLVNQIAKPHSDNQPYQNSRGHKTRRSEQIQYSEFQVQSISINQVWMFLKIILFSYQFNLLSYLKEIDDKTTQKMANLIKLAPGYKPIQYIYTFYMLKYGMLTGLIAAFIYPLPYSILFLMITVDLNVPFVAIFILAGTRSGAIALLLKYCLHFPKHPFHWIVFVFTILIGIFLPNNYIFLLLFAISIFLSFYLHNQQISRKKSEPSEIQSPSGNNLQNYLLDFNEQDLYKQYQMFDSLPQTYQNISLFLLATCIAILWLLQRYLENRELSIFGQVFPISLLMDSKQMLAFFPYIYKQSIGSSTLSSNTLIALSFLFPGPYSKAFMFFIVHNQIKNVIIAYLCLYLPPILLINIFLGYRTYFYTDNYYNIRKSIQAVGNGIVFCLVIWMLREETCFFNSICYSAVVIMVVAKLYRLRQLFAITLGIVLISIRTIILNVDKDISFEKQACF